MEIEDVGICQSEKHRTWLENVRTKATMQRIFNNGRALPAKLGRPRHALGGGAGRPAVWGLGLRASGLALGLLRRNDLRFQSLGLLEA